MADITLYKHSVVDAQQIFFQELQTFNPDNLQADCSEFTTYLLDLLHEELKEIYVPNVKEESKKEDSWQEASKKVTYNNEEVLHNIQHSIIRDIFGGIMR